MSLINEPLMLACTVFIVGTATPGPATLLIATESMRFGRKAGLTSVVAICWCIGIVIYRGYAVAFAQSRATAFYAAWRKKIELSAALLFGTTGIVLLDAM